MIGAGHDLKEVKSKYTERQLILFYETIQKQKNHHYANTALAINLGFAGGDDLKNHLKNLRGK
ncbi:hypothetical protein [Acinetobacter bereziniae]|uniref:hypothetical protein n=1 Tax=Acinetobacter bereziniae TaxID=106648 RepID=UPI0006658CDC|nr:hypothetical protein [Acinetobacter bereziniae]